MNIFKRSGAAPGLFFTQGLMVAWLILLAACTPSHTIDKTVDYARKVGVINQYDINRLHHWVMSPETQLVIAANTGEQIDEQVLTQLLVTQFSPYFGHVATISKAVSYKAAVSSASKQQGDFLIFTTVNQPFADDEHRDAYHEVNLLLTVVDVNSGRIVDRIKMSANTPPWTTYHSGLDKLLAEPLAEVARQLTGSS